jgi:hypothetical protein
MAKPSTTKSVPKVNNSNNDSNKSESVVVNALRAASDIIQRMKLAARAGIQFGGKRDLYEIFGYTRVITSELLVGRYARQDIASRIVDIYADSTWAEPPMITAPGAAGFDEAWTKITKQQRVWTAFSRVDRLANLGRYAILLLGFDDTSQLEASVVPSGDRQLLYVKPLAQLSAKVAKYESNPLSPRFGLPLFYDVEVASNLGDLEVENPQVLKSTTQAIRVHWTRVVHVVEDALESDIVGNPRLIRVCNLLDDILKVAGGTAEMFWLAANRGLQADIDKEMQLDQTDADALADSIEEYQHQLRRVLRTRGVKLNVLGSETPDPTGTFDMLATLLAGATGIPKRILFGTEAGQLASEQDRANWARRISERRNIFANPFVVVPFIERCQFAGILPDATINTLTIKWGDAFHLSPLERAQTSAQMARSIINLSRQALSGFPLANQEEARAILNLEGTIDPNSLELSDLYTRKEEADIALVKAQVESIEASTKTSKIVDTEDDDTTTTQDPQDRPARQRQIGE